MQNERLITDDTRAAQTAAAIESRCEARGSIAAYLDGELNDCESSEFERHIAACVVCRAALGEQRCVLAALDAAFSRTEKFELPFAFAQAIAARAQADMSGVRAPHERRRAFVMCAALALVAFALLGASASRAVFERVDFAARAFASAFNLTVQTAHDLAASLVVFVRVAGGNIPVEAGAPSLPLLLLCGGFLCASLLLRRLLITYRCEPREHRS